MNGRKSGSLYCAMPPAGAIKMESALNGKNMLLEENILSF